MEPELGLPLIIGMVAVVTTSDSIPAVLIGTPGTAGSQATIMDGFPMGQNGEAGKALGAAFFVSGIGGVFGAIVLSVSVPIFKPLVLSFGVSEFLAMGILGLSMVAALAGTDPPKGLIAAGHRNSAVDDRTGSDQRHRALDVGFRPIFSTGSISGSWRSACSPSPRSPICASAVLRSSRTATSRSRTSSAASRSRCATSGSFSARPRSEP